LVYFRAIASILPAFGIFCDRLVHFLTTWYILWSFGVFFHLGMFYQKKSGNPAPGPGREIKGAQFVVGEPIFLLTPFSLGHAHTKSFRKKSLALL
jgi:hypothetical protein